MIRYGLDHYSEMTLTHFQLVDIDKRDQWIDIYIHFEVDDMPSDLTEPSAKIILSIIDKSIVQWVVLDEGCDSEYKFTELEKKQLIRFIEKSMILEKLDEEN